MSAGVIDPSHPLALFSQTTKDPDEFASLAARLRKAVFTASSEVSSRDLAGTVCTGDAGSAPLSLTDNDGCRCVCSDEKKPVPDVAVFDTVCRNVSSRHKALREFAASCSVIIFVCGRESSNGKVLFELCRSVNPRSYKVESADEIPAGIFRHLRGHIHHPLAARESRLRHLRPLCLRHVILSVSPHLILILITLPSIPSRSILISSHPIPSRLVLSCLVSFHSHPIPFHSQPHEASLCILTH